MIRIQALHKSFGDVHAVAGLDLEIETGETFGLLGPNGAGKSTTIGCAIGVVEPDSGSVSLGELGPPTDPQARRALGVAPQKLALYEDLSGEENVRFFGQIQGLTGARLAERTAAVLASTGLTDRRKDRAKGYSGGMQRRLNLACALVHDPRILFLDEPTAGVDPQSRNHLFESVRAMKRAGKTIVYTTHYMEEAERLCDRVAIVDHGKLLALGTVAELIAAHGGQPSLELDFDDPVQRPDRLPEPDDDGVVRMRTDDPTGELVRLRDQGVAFRSASVRRPDLETVFLNLTGRSLRDQ